jgi:hypothetical protein
MEKFSHENRSTKKIVSRGGKQISDYVFLTEFWKNGEEKQKILGEGSFGCVKLARNRETEKLYAIKIVF